MSVENMNVVPVVIVESNSDAEIGCDSSPIATRHDTGSQEFSSGSSTALPKMNCSSLPNANPEQNHYCFQNWVRYTRTRTGTCPLLNVSEASVPSRGFNSCLSLTSGAFRRKAESCSSLMTSPPHKYGPEIPLQTRSHRASKTVLKYPNSTDDYSLLGNLRCTSASEPYLPTADIQSFSIKKAKPKFSTPIFYVTDHSEPPQKTPTVLPQEASMHGNIVHQRKLSLSHNTRLRKPGIFNNDFLKNYLIRWFPHTCNSEYQTCDDFKHKIDHTKMNANNPTKHRNHIGYSHTKAIASSDQSAQIPFMVLDGMNFWPSRSSTQPQWFATNSSENCTASTQTSSTESTCTTPKSEKRKRRISLPVFRHFIDRCDSWIKAQKNLHKTITPHLEEPGVSQKSRSVSVGGQMIPETLGSSNLLHNTPILSPLTLTTRGKWSSDGECSDQPVDSHTSSYRRKTLSLQETTQHIQQLSEAKSTHLLTVPSRFSHQSFDSTTSDSGPKYRAVSVDLGTTVINQPGCIVSTSPSQSTCSMQSLNLSQVPRWYNRLSVQRLSTRSISDVDSQTSSFMATSSNTPDWTVESVLGEHLWIDTNSSGDLCYVPEPECCKSGGKKKCTVCRITCHVKCMDTLNFSCRHTYREADVREYRDGNTKEIHTVHHWVNRRRHDNRCKCCGKSFQAMFSFGSKEAVAKQCTWCKASYHSKAACFDESMNDEPCNLGAHAALIVPPHWIIKMPEKNTFKSSIRRSSSLLSPHTSGLENVTPQLPTSVSRPDRLSQTDASSLRIDSASDGRVSPSTGSSNLLLAPQLPFVIKPNPLSAAKQKPLLVFLNPKSGGNQGFSLLRKFQWLLNPRQVFDLSQGGPRMGLELFARVPNLRVLACGGDGTVGWVLSTIEELGLSPMPPVAVLPLGTGNDLARTLHWGAGYADESISKILRSIEHGDIVALDRWHIECASRSDITIPTMDNECEDGSRNRHLSSTLPLKIFNNYFSLGADAATALEFHESREANPEKFNSRLKNKMFYAGCGGKDLILRSWRDLSEHITLVCDGKDLTPLIRSLRPHAILFLNIPKYGSGTLPWGTVPATAGFEPQRIDDGLLEVIGLSSTTLALLQVGGHGDRICQCRTVSMTTDKVIPMQMDGEPCRLLPSKIEIRCSHQAVVVQKQGRHSGTLSRDNSAYFNGQRAGHVRLHIFVISLKDYEYISEDALALRGAATFYGTVSVSFQEDLASVRKSIIKLSDSQAADESEVKKDQDTKEANPEFQLSNSWLFVDSTTAASRFFRIDPKREAAHFILDICNMEELFLIDEGLKPRLVQGTSGEKILAETETETKPGLQPTDPHSGSEAPGSAEFEEAPVANTEDSAHTTKENKKDGDRELGTTTAEVHMECIVDGAESLPKEAQTMENTLQGSPVDIGVDNQMCTESTGEEEPLGNGSTVDTDQTLDNLTSATPDIKASIEAGEQLQATVNALLDELLAAATELNNSGPMLIEIEPQNIDLKNTADQVDELHQVTMEKPCPVLGNDELSSSASGQPCVIEIAPSDSNQLESKITRRKQRSRQARKNSSPSLEKQSFQTRLDKAFLSAARKGITPNIEALLQLGANSMAVDYRGRSALHLATKFGCETTVSLLVKHAPPELLELREYEKNQTALHKAATYRRRNICRILIEAGACPTSRDANGKRPRKIAMDADDRTLAHYLQNSELIFMIEHGKHAMV